MSTCQGCGAELPPSRGSRPRKWCSNHCRRHTMYSRPCLDCGKPTYSGNAIPPERCLPCWGRRRQIWTEEAVIAAIQAWAEQSGGIPPAATDWNPNHATKNGHPEKADRFYEDDAWPLTGTVLERFGSWNTAIRAAGFVPRAVGTYGREGEDPDLCREIRARYEAGESTPALAASYGTSYHAIAYRIHKAGGTTRTPREASQLRWGRAA